MHYIKLMCLSKSIELDTIQKRIINLEIEFDLNNFFNHLSLKQYEFCKSYTYTHIHMYIHTPTYI